ncbi:MAG TPA: FMN-binding protein [Gammaproteobacteria bacterium]|nr:FMN-binding protein [Gammaproteobacteria bacterium]
MTKLSWMLAGLTACWLAIGGAASSGPGRYVGADEFLYGAFSGDVPASAVLWVDKALRDAIENTLGHRFDALRVRYWRDDARSAWILNEIGKEQPITIGVIVADGAIETVRVLEFREARGWEVRYPFFTDQFAGVRLADSRRIERANYGINRATRSVAAVTRAAKLALILHARTEPPHS